MDVFKHNWTQRMKTDPWTNAVLNSERIALEPRSVEYWRPIKASNNWLSVSRTYRKTRVYTNEKGDHRFGLHRTPYKYYQRIKKNVDNKNPRGVLKEIKINYRPSGERNPDMWENTRPQSLYNLHYATLR